MVNYVDFLRDTLSYSTALLQVATVVFMLAGHIRKYAFVLIYCLLQLGTSMVEMTVTSRFGPRSRLFYHLFWTDEIGLDLVLFFILIVLTYRAMEGSPAQAAMGRMLGAVIAIVMALPFVLFKGAFVKTAWFDHMSQLLNFGAALLNLGLWTALLGSGKRDPQLLTVSAGFGVVATGVATSFGLRRLVHFPGAGSNSLAWMSANLVFVAAHLGGALILCWAFRPVGFFRNKTVRNLLCLSQTLPTE